MKFLNRVHKILTVLVIILVLGQCSTVNDPKYKAAVIEFSPSQNKNLDQQLEENLVFAGELIRNNLSGGTPGEDADIVVFPELALNRQLTAVKVPDPKTKPILCDKQAPNPSLMNRLSCWAGSLNKYMIFNLMEKTECTHETQKEQNDSRPCGADGLNRYNTNVVFDRKGALIARYRKVNPYFEPLINTTVMPDYTTFETDFGVTFGTAICFDILFKTPIQELVAKHNISDIIYPTHWYSELPFLTANQIQQALSYANNINLLVAGGNYPATGTTGSGIFGGRSGALISKMYGQITNEVLYHDVPKIGFRPFEDSTVRLNTVPSRTSIIPQRLKGIKILTDPTVKSFIFKDIKNDGKIEETVCHKDVCCEFKLDVKLFNKVDGYNSYSYKMVAFSGVRNYFNGFRLMPFKTCAIIACTNSSIDSCGEIYNDNSQVQNRYYFSDIKIIGKFDNHEKVLFMPSTVDQMFKPLPVREFDLIEKTNGKSKNVEMNLNVENSDLLTFGIFALDYKGSSSKQAAISAFVISISIIISRIF